LERAEPETETVDVPTACKILGIGRQAGYAGVRSGEIPSIRVGRLVKVPLPALRRMLKGGAGA
jgi:excisionase family DNA binding protein